MKFLNHSCIFLSFLPIIITTNGCSTEKSTLPFRYLNVQRDESGGDSFIVVFHNFETKQIARSLTIAIKNRELDLEPKRYLFYPFLFTYVAAEMSAVLALNLLNGASGSIGDGAVILLGFSAGLIAVGTTGGFLVGLGRGSS
jgi:hypothetical protein